MPVTLSRHSVVINTVCMAGDAAYNVCMPKIWSDTIDAHRREVHAAVVAATAKLVAEHGLLGVTMSRIAQDAGIGRATLYKYFPDVESILTRWHDEQITAHLDQLAGLRTSDMPPGERLASAITMLAQMSYRAGQHSPGTDLVATLHATDHVTKADQDLRLLLLSLVEDAIQGGAVRDDVPSGELASYCANAAMGARHLPSAAAAQRLAALTMAGLKP